MVTFSRIAKNALLGDGSIIRNKNGGSIHFMSTDIKLLKYKENMLIKEGYEGMRWGTQPSGYGGDKTIYNISVYSSAKALDVLNADIYDIIKSLDKEDLFLWYMDDGSWHIHRNTMHLYSNGLDKGQSEALMDRIKEIYGIRPNLRIDRKQDGRWFYYLYFPRDLVRLFRPEFKGYVMAAGIDTMYYKFGGLDYVEKEARKLLSDETVLAIRSAIALGESSTEIQRKYCVSRNQYRGIKEGKTYKHVKEEV